MNTNETNDPNPWRPLEPGELLHSGIMYRDGAYYTRRPRPAPTPCPACEQNGGQCLGHYLQENAIPKCGDCGMCHEGPCDEAGGGDQQMARPCLECQVIGQINCPEHTLVNGGDQQTAQTAREWVSRLVGSTGCVDADFVYELADRADRAEAQMREAQVEALRWQGQAAGYREQRYIATKWHQIAVEQRDKAEAECDRLREALELIQANMQRIDAIPWGNDGDGGAADLAEDSHAIARAALNQTTNTND